MSTTMRDKGTLEFALRPYRVDWSVIEEKHAAVLGMMEIFLGVAPHHCRYSYIWPPAYETMSVLVPNLFNVPFCDFGVGPIGGDLRSLAAYAVSRSFGCSYCSAHCAGLGTIRQGHDVFLAKNTQAMMPVPDPAVFNPKELAAINIGKKLGAVPNEVTSDDIRSMARALTSEEEECVINATVLMGFLNRFMDTLGMTLELEPLKMGNEHLAESGWTAGISFDPEGDEELMEEDRAMAERREERKKQACGGFTFMKMLVGAKMADSASLKGTPTSEKNVKQLCLERAGFAPYYLVGEEKSKMANARNALVWAFTRRLCQGSEEVPAALKQTMGYMLATAANNTILRAHFAFMAHRNGVSVTDLANATTAEGGDTDGGQDLKEAAALSMARACSGTPGPMPRELVALLMRQYTPAGVIELVNTLSLVSMLQRWTSIYMPKQIAALENYISGQDGFFSSGGAYGQRGGRNQRATDKRDRDNSKSRGPTARTKPKVSFAGNAKSKYEPEILAFVEENGSALSLDPTKPCTEEQSGWRALAAEIRSS